MHIKKSLNLRLLSKRLFIMLPLLMVWSTCTAADGPFPPKATSLHPKGDFQIPQNTESVESEAKGIRVIPFIPLPKDLGFRKDRLGTAAVSAPAPQVLQSLKNDISPPLREIVPARSEVQELRVIPNKQLPKDRGHKIEEFAPIQNSGPVIKTGKAGQSTLGSGVRPGVNFEGLNNRNSALPPDTQGDVGPHHYIQIANVSFQIFDKSGNTLFGPVDNNVLWSGFGGICENNNNGDPIVLYDQLADRWLLSQFAFNFPNDFHQCIAVSQSGDPTGAWYLYDFQISTTKFNDYPKFGVWPDGYYMSINQFDGDTEDWAGAGVVIFERDKMLQGQAARMVYFDDPAPQLGGMLPSDLDGAAPPAGTPNFFMQFNDDAWGFAQDQLEIWQAQVNWANPGSSTFTQLAILPTDPFDSNLCWYARSCIPQPDTIQGVDALTDRMMYRLQYRNFGTHQSLVANHTVDVNGRDQAGIRWYELRNTGQGWAIHQQGTYAPDRLNRWMGSIAMDSKGNIALGYSVSGSELCDQPFWSEGFEGGTIPPADWTHIQTNSSETWVINTDIPHSGNNLAAVFYDPNLQQQDEILLSQTLNLTSGTLEFYSVGSLYWCRDFFDNCDLEVWIVPGAWDGGAGDDIFVGLADDDWADDFVWARSSFDLTPLLPGGPVKIAFRYVGLDGDAIGLDDVAICTDLVGGAYPSIRYTGRLADDPLGTLPRGENTIINGFGSQTHNANRWGDYSMMSVDPATDLFWYTQEYYETTSSAGWQTRIASFGLGGPTGGSLEGARFLLLGQDIP